MINLFNINNYVIDTSKLGNHLHGPVVDQFCKEFCEYVGAKYGCTLNSASNAIFLAMENKKLDVEIPAMLPPVVFNSLYNAGSNINFVDNTEWVGSSYTLYEDNDYKIIDSAQRVDRDQFHEANDDDLMIFSFYPTKPVGGMDGGIIVSNNKDKIDYFKQRSLNGMSFAENNWEREQQSIGWKMYMNSSQAYVALQNLRKLDYKKTMLQSIRTYYNSVFNLENTSDHLYRITTTDRDDKIKALHKMGIVSGIHYKPLSTFMCPSSMHEGNTTLSIPFHEKLTQEEVERVVECINKL